MNCRRRVFQLVMLFVMGVMFCNFTGLVWAGHAGDAMAMDNPDKQQIYSERILIGMGPGESGVVASGMVVPEGKRLIVEHVSIGADLQSDQLLLEVFVGSSQGSSKTANLVATVQGRSGDGVRDFFAASQPIKMRLDAGETIRCGALRNSTFGNAGIRVTVLGYLIDYP